MKERTILSEGLKLSILYAPVESPKAVVQIVHGMLEHKERYLDFIEYLNSIGYSVVISDNRGHGKSVNEDYPLGHIGSPELMVEDQFQVTKFIKENNPDLPVYMFAHSMGSLIARKYLFDHDKEIEKLILSGTVGYVPIAFIGVELAKRMKPMAYSKLMWVMANQGSISKSLSWLSYNQENIERYMADPLCSIRFTNYANWSLFSMVKELKDIKKHTIGNPKLQILSLSGRDDRTTGGTKNLKYTLGFLKKAGYWVACKEYAYMKHEILNEDQHDLVYEDVKKFYSK